MGTSTNQASPDTTIWAVVAACYESEIPLEKTATFLWRAISTQNEVFVRQLKSDTVASLVRHSARRSTGLTVTMSSDGKQNTFALELTKRSAGSASHHISNKGETSLSCLFRQLTAYFVARDISGYVGPNYRCKTFAEVTQFKIQLADVVAARVRQFEDAQMLAPAKWPQSINVVLQKLSQL